MPWVPLLLLPLPSELSPVLLTYRLPELLHQLYLLLHEPPNLLLVLLAASPAENSADTTRDLDVWLIPHSHCDTGWIETVDGYYNSSVELILSTVLFLSREGLRLAMIRLPQLDLMPKPGEGRAAKDGRQRFVNTCWLSAPVGVLFSLGAGLVLWWTTAAGADGGAGGAVGAGTQSAAPAAAEGYYHPEFGQMV